MRLKLPHWTTLLLAASLVLNVAFVILLVNLHRWHTDREELRAEEERGLEVEWRLADGSIKDETPTIYELARGAHPIEVRAGSTLKDANIPRISRVAALVGKYGTLESIGFDGGEKLAIEAWIKHLGPQPGVKEFLVLYCPFGDEASTYIAGYPEITGMTIYSQEFTGEKFPMLPKLTVADFMMCNITPAGLTHIAQCPVLERLHVSEPEEGSIPLRDAYFALKEARQDLELRGIE